ncbi:MAG: prepilin-type N-terminal cleavage/methylation domain-containing protein [Gammaproteobacteria bacterium]|nr:prepilin-type N-terminal cleavage/methylation domain-containing protein [Gammaproteobacteria bacterium]
MHTRLLVEKGFTLIEIVISIVIVGIALSTLILVTAKSTERSVDPLYQEQANAIAQAYMEEIMQKNFCDPDWDMDCRTNCVTSACLSCKGMGSGWTTESRANYDDVCDYSGTDNPPLDQNGDVFATGLGDYSVTVSIDDSATATLDTLAGNNGEVVRIDVTVSNPGMRNDVQLSSFRANF